MSPDSPDPHPARVTAWVVHVAVCPACQVAPGTPCHLDGRALPDVHPQRRDEALRTADPPPAPGHTGPAA